MAERLIAAEADYSTKSRIQTGVTPPESPAQIPAFRGILGAQARYEFKVSVIITGLQRTSRVHVYAYNRKQSN